MQRLTYMFERTPAAQPSESARPILDDALLALTMAGLGLPGLRRRVDGSAPQATVAFPDENTLRAFNLRIERALAVRGLRIRKIRVVEEPAAAYARHTPA